MSVFRSANEGEALRAVALAIGSQIYGFCDPDETPNSWVVAMRAAQVALEVLEPYIEEEKGHYYEMMVAD